jgi:hypothetical protein
MYLSTLSVPLNSRPSFAVEISYVAFPVVVLPWRTAIAKKNYCTP